MHLIMNTMFDTFMELPLFCGVGHERMAEIIGKARLHFLKFEPGSTIINAGEPCDHVAFIISGAVRVNLSKADGILATHYTLSSPDVLSPEFLFGRATNYPSTITALDTVSILRISKQDYIKILKSDKVYLFNLLNLLSTNSQKAFEGIMAIASGKIRERIALWITALTPLRATDIVLRSLGTDLSTAFGVQHSEMSSTLEAMKADGLIKAYTETKIAINDRRGLQTLLREDNLD